MQRVNDLQLIYYNNNHYIEGYSESTEPIDAVNILPLARFEPTTSTTPPSTTTDIDATNCATETSPIKDVQEALILTTPDAVHVVYWSYIYIYKLILNIIGAMTNNDNPDEIFIRVCSLSLEKRSSEKAIQYFYYNL